MRCWEVWFAGEEPFFIERFADKTQAKMRVARLKNGRPWNHYELRRRKSQARFLFEKR